MLIRNTERTKWSSHVRCPHRPTARNADRFAYSRRGEVASATVAGEASAYAYDGSGNFTSVTGGAITNTYTANELNQYEEIASNGTLVVSNRYDHLGRRVAKIASDGTHTFLYDGWRPVVETVATPSGGTDRIEYHWGKATRPPSTPLDGRWR